MAKKDYTSDKIEAQVEFNRAMYKLLRQVMETFESGSKEDIEKLRREIEELIK